MRLESLETRVKELDVQVAMLQGIVDSYQASFKKLNKMAEDAVTTVMTESESIQTFIKTETEKAFELQQDRIRKELMEASDSI